MPTQLEIARQGLISKEVQQVADQEGLDAHLVRQRLAEGRIVLPCNPKRPNQKPVGIGQGLRTKANASIGTSSGCANVVNAISGYSRA